ncbi:MAG: efflux RND transporter periplasmic adaptor subunit, partial [Bacteroidales bacterium]
KELYAVGGASKQQLDQAKAQYDVAKDAFSSLDENTDLLSPIDGVVTSRSYDPGDMYNAQQPILTIMQIQPVKLLINVSEKLYPRIKEGMSVDVLLDVYGDELFKGKVNLIYPTIDEMTRTFSVEVLLPNSNNKVRPGMFARVVLPIEKVERIVVSDKAVVKQAGANERFVFVVEGDRVVHTKVETGRRMDNKYEIINGLKPGQKVVVNGAARLVNGSKIEIKK